MSERHIDCSTIRWSTICRGLSPASNSGFMIAQYTLCEPTPGGPRSDRRRLLTPGLQEDILSHPTFAANKLLAVIDNAERRLSV